MAYANKLKKTDLDGYSFEVEWVFDASKALDYVGKGTTEEIHVAYITTLGIHTDDLKTQESAGLGIFQHGVTSTIFIISTKQWTLYLPPTYISINPNLND